MALWFMIAREKDKKAKQYKKNGCILLLMKKEKHSSCLHNSEPVEEEDKRPQIEAKNITSMTDKG